MRARAWQIPTHLRAPGIHQQTLHRLAACACAPRSLYYTVETRMGRNSVRSRVDSFVQPVPALKLV